MKAVVGYVPVIHRGYLDFLYAQRADRVYVLSRGQAYRLRSLQKDMRALEPSEAVDALNQFVWAGVLNDDAIQFLRRENAKLVMPDEDISHEIAEEFFPDLEVEYVATFLRWDRHASEAELSVDPDELISVADIDRLLISKLIDFSAKSPDWWRQVGALVVQNDEIVLCAYNRTVPNDDLVQYEGDPRGNFSRGVNIELSTVLHAEAAVIAEAAKRGPRLEGARMYVTTFPCPPCAKLVAYSGISVLFYADGYAMLDGRRLLRQQGVKVVRVQM